MNPFLAFSISAGIVVLIGISTIFVKVLKSKKERHDENIKLALAIRLIEQDGGISFLRQENVRRVSVHEFKVQTQLGDGAESTVYPDGTQNISITVMRYFREVMCHITLAVLVGDGKPRFSVEIDAPVDGASHCISSQDIAAARNERAVRSRVLAILTNVDATLRDRAKA